MSKRKLPMVEVIWVDAIGPSGHGWEDAGGYQGVQKERADVRTVGMLVHRDRHWVRVALSHDPSAEQFNGVMQIPAGDVLTIRALEPKRKAGL